MREVPQPIPETDDTAAWRPRGRHLTFAVGLAVATIAIAYGVVPHIKGVHEAWQQAWSGDVWWMAAAVALEACSFAGYAALFVAVLGGGRIDWAAAWLITLAGVAATRLLAAGGAGGIALTAWALQRSGRDAPSTAVGMASFLVLLYAVYMAALAIASAGLLCGLFAGYAPVALTSAGLALGAGALLAVPLLAVLPRRERDPQDTRWRARLLRALDTVPGSVRHALALVRTRDPRLLGAIAWWAFDIGALAASLHAFGEQPALAPLVVAYFMGMLGNLLPLPGGVGGVEGGMIGGLLAIGVGSGTAVGAVLAYRLVSLWLPTACGIVAQVVLVRRTRAWALEGA